MVYSAVYVHRESGRKPVFNCSTAIILGTNSEEYTGIIVVLILSMKFSGATFVGTMITAK